MRSPSRPPRALPMDSSLNHRRPAQSSSISENTAPIILMSDFLMGKNCTTRLRRLSSRLARSCTLLVRSLTWCPQGSPGRLGRQPRPLPAPRRPWSRSPQSTRWPAGRAREPARGRARRTRPPGYPARPPSSARSARCRRRCAPGERCIPAARHCVSSNKSRHLGLQTTCGGNRRPVGLRSGRHRGNDVIWCRSMLPPHGKRLCRLQSTSP